MLQSVPDQFLSLRFQYTSVYIVTYDVIFWSVNLRIRNNRGLPGNRQSKCGWTENARLETQHQTAGLVDAACMESQTVYFTCSRI